MAAWSKTEVEIDLSELGIGLSFVSPKNIISALISLNLFIPGFH